MANIIKKQEARSKKQGNYLNSILNFLDIKSHIKPHLSLLTSHFRLNRSHLSPLTSQLSTQRAFTLIEYLVAITILAGLVGGIMFTLNPFTQIDRSRDAARRQDLQQVKNALEAYYQDTSCYPLEVPFGQEWSVNGEVYMKETPEDPTCGQLNGYCYEYITDSSSQCPQWNVAFARLSEVPAQSTTVCPLSSISDTCVPQGYDEHWACVMSGAVNCSLLAASGFGYDTGTGAVPTPTGPYVAPTPGPGSATYTLGGGSGFNPYLKTMTISPLYIAAAGIAQSFYVTAEDATSDITQVRVHLFSDNQAQVLTLNFAGGTVRNGTWAGTISADTYNNVYAMAIVGVNANGDDRCKVLTPGGEVETSEGLVYFGGADARADAICDQVNNN